MLNATATGSPVTFLGLEIGDLATWTSVGAIAITLFFIYRQIKEDTNARYLAGANTLFEALNTTEALTYRRTLYLNREKIKTKQITDEDKEVWRYSGSTPVYELSCHP